MPLKASPTRKRRPINLLDAAGVAALGGVVERPKHSFLQRLAAGAVFVAHARTPSLVALVQVGFVQFRQGMTQLNEPWMRRFGGDFGEALVAAFPHASAVEAHELEKDFEVFGPAFGIIGRLEERGENDGTGEDDGLGAPPFALDATLSAQGQEAAEATAASDLAERLLETLSPEDRLVVQMLDLEGRTSVEVEKLTGWSSVAVRVRAFRARRKLRNELLKLEQQR